MKKYQDEKSSLGRESWCYLPQRISWSMAAILFPLALFLLISPSEAFCPAKYSKLPTGRVSNLLSVYPHCSRNANQRIGNYPLFTTPINYKASYELSALQMGPEIGLQTAVTAHEIFMPSLSSTMKEGKIVSWNKKIGDRIEIGDTVMVVESDKADMEVESFSEGYLATYIVQEGDNARVGETVGLVAEKTEDIPIIQQQGLNCNIPSGDGNRHDGTTAWNVKEHHAENCETSPNDREKAVDEMATDSTTLLPEALRDSTEAKEIFMPALSSTMKTGKIAKWLKKEGDRISVGDIALIVESDKADMDVECFEDGYIAEILVKEGEEARVGETVALISPTIENIDKIRRLGIAVIQSGSDKRHDMTTAVFDRSTENRQLTGASETLKMTKNAPPHAAVLPEVESTDIFMPALSSTMKEGKIIKWLKKPGDAIKAGDSVMIVESDKADMEVESFDDGYLAIIMTEEGSTVKVLDPVGKIVSNREDVERLQLATAVDAANQRTREFAEMSTSGSDTLHDSLLQLQARQFNPPTKLNANEERLQGFVPASVDQDIQDQLPENFSVDQLAEVFVARIKDTEEGRKLIAEKESSTNGAAQWKAIIDRIKLRIPSLNILSDNTPPRTGSLWHISGQAKAACDRFNLSYTHTEEHKNGGRIFHDDVSAASTKTGSSHWGREAYYAKQLSSKSESSMGPASVTPSASLLAKAKGFDPSSLTGTGPYGRVVKGDIEHHLGLPVSQEKQKPSQPPKGISSSPPPTSLTQQAMKEVPLDPMQVAIARNMEATLSAPVFRVSRALVTTKLDELYKQLKPSGVTMSALLVKAVALTLEKHPIMNAAYSATKGGSI
ncbi:pyruvate dehydrogenase complex subunit PDH-E2, partial [Cardiosporidium cionae]